MAKSYVPDTMVDTSQESPLLPFITIQFVQTRGWRPERSDHTTSESWSWNFNTGSLVAPPGTPDSMLCKACTGGGWHRDRGEWGGCRDNWGETKESGKTS